MPVDFYDGGAEHVTLHLLYSRFWHKFLNDIGVAPGIEPYKSRRNHGMLLGEGGTKMSKSLGNVINPDDLVEQFGTDVVRLYLMFVGPYEGTSEWSERAIQGVDRFVKRFWEFLTQNLENPADSCDEDVEKAVSVLVKTIDRNIPSRRFNTSVASIMEFYNKTKDKTLCKECLSSVLIAIAPFMPHLSEELWNTMGHKDSIHKEQWPKVKEVARDAMVEIPVQINGKIRSKITIPASAVEKAVLAVALEDEKVQKNLAGNDPKKAIYVPGKILTIVV